MTPAPSFVIWAIAWWSCGPQSQRLEPKTSPVRHSLWTRTRTFLFRDVPFHQRDVVLPVGVRAVEVQGKIPVIRGHLHDFEAFDQLLARPAELDQVFDGAEPELVFLANFTSAGRRAISPESSMISQMTPTGRQPASRAKSTAASV